MRWTAPSCANNRTVTAIRTGDADSTVNVADPVATRALVESPAQALHGNYQETDTDKDGNRYVDGELRHPVVLPPDLESDA